MKSPLAALLRPKYIKDLVWQEKIIAQVQSYIQGWAIPSMIFWWPPWSWKTTLAIAISNELQADFIHLSWVSSKKSDLQDIIEQATVNKQYNKSTIVFLDEIHRWNKAQQDSLLPYVEEGTIILIGATTENPSFTINNALLSRCKVVVFDKHTEKDIEQFIFSHLETIYQHYPGRVVNNDIIVLISQLANWDLRNALNILEAGLMMKKSWDIDKAVIKSVFDKPLYYDRDGEEHYNIISAVHKSLRDSDGDAACYRIQRMLVAGEDPLYICRRLVRFASEDIWPADNNALLLANQVYDTCAKIWMPECDVAIFQLALYLAKAKKDNICYVISKETKKDIYTYGNLPVPMHIRNAPTKLMKELWYHKWYKYAHNFKDAIVDQEHFPDELKGRKYTKKPIDK